MTLGTTVKVFGQPVHWEVSRLTNTPPQHVLRCIALCSAANDDPVLWGGRPVA